VLALAPVDVHYAHVWLSENVIAVLSHGAECWDAGMRADLVHPSVESSTVGLGRVLDVPGADADDHAGDRNYLVLAKPGETS
jgi:hypothetical protein